MTLSPARGSFADTIVAQSTATGAAAIAIVRLAGPQARHIASSLARADLPAAYRLARQRLYDAGGGLLDEAMVVQMPGPHSYTGDDVVEMHLHGGPAVSQAVQAACLALGARGAEAGEFTRRAWANGRMSLTSVEAIASLVHAETEAERVASVSLLAGGLDERLRPLLQALMELVARARAALDFPEDVPEGPFPAAANASLRQVSDALSALLQRRLQMDAPRPQWVLRGPSNAGKSTLFNALIGHERALTDAAPGTTRDAISASWGRQGVRVTLWDTAGHHDQAKGVEARGIAYGQKLAQQASVVVWLLGPKLGWPPAEACEQAAPLLLVGSHADTFASARRQEVEREAAARGLDFAGWLSLPAGEGLNALEARLQGTLTSGGPEAQVAINDRHVEALQAASRALQAALALLQDERPAEDIALGEVEAALSAVDSIFGEGVEAEVFEQIFARFCIGK